MQRPTERVYRTANRLLQVIIAVTFLNLISQAASAQDLASSYHAIAPTLVLIRVDDGQYTRWGTGFIMHSSAKGSLILTAAHVLVGESLIQPLEGVGRVYVYWLHQPYGPDQEQAPLASNITVPTASIDVRLDAALIRVDHPNLPVLCFGTEELPAGSRIGLAAFSQRQLRGKERIKNDQSIEEQLSETWPTVREGTLGSRGRSVVEFYIPSEEGFSGGPIFDERSSIAFAIVHGSANFAGMVPRATDVSMAYGFDLERFVDTQLQFTEFVRGNSRKLVTYPYPDISRRFRMVLLDLPTSGTPNSQALNNRIEFVLRVAMANSIGIPLDEPPIEVTESGLDTSSKVENDVEFEMRSSKYRQLCNAHNASGVVAIKRSYNQDNNGGIIFSISYQDCFGSTYKTIVTPLIHVTDKTPENDLVGIAQKIADSFLPEQPVDVARFGNLRTYGVFIGNGEHRAFFSLHRIPSGAVLATNVLPVGSAYHAGLRDGDVVSSINKLDAGTMYFMTDEQLNAVVRGIENDADGLGFALTTFGERGRDLTFRSYNVCGYLSLLQNTVR
jgi:hypothetical protein